MKTVSEEKINELTSTEVAELQEQLLAVDVQIDGQTFQPYKELHGRRYYIEAMMDDKAQNG